MPRSIQELIKSMIQAHKDQPLRYITKIARQDAQDHKAIMNKVARWLYNHGIYTSMKQEQSMQQVYTCEQKGKRKTHYTCVQRLSRAIQSGVENHHVLITSRAKDQVPSSSCSPTASPHLHTRRQRRPSLGSQRVSKHILGNPILGHTGK